MESHSITYCAKQRGERNTVISTKVCRLVLGALLLIAGVLGLGLHTAQAQDPPAPALDAGLRKTVSASPGVCGTDNFIDAAPGATVYICYTITNTGSLAFEPLDLIDNYDTANFESVAWQKTPGLVLEPGATLGPTSENGLIRPLTVAASLTSYAGWGVAAADGSQTRQITSNEVTINVVSLSTQASLTGHTAAGTAPAVNCVTPAVTLTSYQNPVYLCVTLTNGGSITLTQHHVSIPGFGIDFTLDKPLGPSGTVSSTILFTNLDNSAMAPRLSAPSMTSRAYITSTSGALNVSAVTEPVVVNGPTASVTLQKTLNTDPNTCSATTTLTNVAYGQIIYYCLVLINSASLTYTDHIFTEQALNIAGSFNEVLPPGGRISITNNYLQVSKGIAPFLGPITATQSINNSMLYTASNPTIGYRAITAASASVTVLLPTPTNTGAPTPTNTPIAFDTPIPTPTITPIPPTPTPTWTWTPTPTPTPPPTVLVFSTPGGQAPTPYPTLPGLQAGAQTNQFVSPLSPFAATPTAQAFAFPTPVLDPLGATATAQAQFAFPTPVLDPFGATATAQAQFAFPTPVLDPFGATATAQTQISPLPTPIVDPLGGATGTMQAQLLFPTPMIDPAAATATAQAFLSLQTPVLDAFAATAIAQAATISASVESGQSAVSPTLPAESALVPPNGIITVTATFTPESAAALAQRPVEPPALPLDTRPLFDRVLQSAGSTVALLWFLAGSLLFFVTAGVLAGLSFRAKEQARFALEPGEASEKFVAQPAPPVQAADETKAGDSWPDSLP